MEKTLLVVWYIVGSLGLAGEVLAFKLGEMKRSEPARHAELEELFKEPARLSLYVAAGASMGPFALAYLDGWKLVGLHIARRITGGR